VANKLARALSQLAQIPAWLTRQLVETNRGLLRFGMRWIIKGKIK